MEAQKHHCQGCGSEIPADMINFKTREATCPWCGLHVVFPKRHSTASPNAAIALEEGSKLFLEGHYQNAADCAKSVLTMATDNAAALFIESYYNAFVHEPKNSKAIERVLREVLPNCEFEIEEEEYFKKFLIKTVKHTSEYLYEIVNKFYEYDDAKELGEFMDNFVPYALNLKQDLNWFTPDMCKLLVDVTKKCDCPKTWFALYNQILKNPESPLSDGSFFLKTRTERVYNGYLLPVGEIFKNIRDNALKAKFGGAWQKAKAAYEAKMN